jgi:YidC/Oxa1 family membrane protein insertase
MFNFANLLNGAVVFPENGTGWFPAIGKFCYILINWIHDGGAVAYGVAIILFTIILKLLLIPLDFATKYFTKRNTNFMQKMKPEEDVLREQYANEPSKLMMARQQLYKQHGYKMGGFFMFMLINMFVIMAVFFSVFGALNAISNLNVQKTAEELHTAYVANTTETGEPADETAFNAAINAAYEKHQVGFLWIKNIWKPDVPWANAQMDKSVYNANAKGATNIDVVEGEYDQVFAALGEQNQTRNWNGLFILIALAGLTSWASAWLGSKVMAAKKKSDDANKKEPAVVYSMRDTRGTTDKPVPSVDPVMMGRIMKIVLPAIMVLFTLSSTAALAIYIIVNSVMSTVITYSIGYPVDKILAWQDKKSEANGKTGVKHDPNIINPHAKYFKTKRK